MSDLITLSCPSCGGNLSVSPAQQSLKCRHCGTEHWVREEAGGIMLEAFARCPRCGRNDRVERLSAILRSQVKAISGTTKISESYSDSEGQVRSRIVTVPTSSTEATHLAQRLAPPPRPRNPPGGSGCFPALVYLSAATFLVAGVSCALTSLSSAFSASTSQDLLNAAASLLCIAGPAVAVSPLIFYWGTKASANAREDRERKLAAWNERLAEWDASMRRWNSAYYCSRDDGVFIPGRPGFTDVDGLYGFLAST